MSKIHSLKISNFRGIKTFDGNFWNHDFICLVGRGDTGKSTILESISYVLSPSYNLSFYDTDFYNCNIDESIEISIFIYELPELLITEDKYGLDIIHCDNNGNIQEEINDNTFPILNIILRVDRELEPQWFIKNAQQEEKEIRASDRAKINAFLVSDYVNQHFYWNKGFPLYTLLKQEEVEGTKNSFIIDVLRDAKLQIDKADYSYLQPVLGMINDNINKLGLNIHNSATKIDFKDIFFKDGKLSLHDDTIPFRLKGKGTKRIISIAIQSALAKFGGISLIDELEQGLEPDRIKHIVRSMLIDNKKNKGQIFITTHSQNIIEEIECENIYNLVNNDGSTEGCFVPPQDKYQSLIRTCQSALYAKKVIVCEGKTEIGFCRALDNYRISKGKHSLTLKDIVYVDGAGGSNFTDRAIKLNDLGLTVCVLCDSDSDNNLNPSKEKLREKGVSIFDWDNEKSIEKQIFDDLNSDAIDDILDYYRNDKKTSKDEVWQKIKVNYSCDEKEYSKLKNHDKWFIEYSTQLREAIYKSATLKIQKPNGKIDDKSWFKRIDHGEALGQIVFNHYESLNGTVLKNKIEELNSWIDYEC